jgi:hypothetical protein
MNLYNIKISSNDIFDYVVGNTNYDPIERSIDPTRFEVFDEFIYDHKNKCNLDQDAKFKYFCTEVSKLRSISKGMDNSEIQAICIELEEVSPKQINLG